MVDTTNLTTSAGVVAQATSNGVQFTGTDGDDVIVGGAGADRATGGAGNDTIALRGGNDTAFDGTGNDVYDMGAGDDLVFVDSGIDLIDGGVGNDTVVFSDPLSAYTLTLLADGDSGGRWQCSDARRLRAGPQRGELLVRGSPVFLRATGGNRDTGGRPGNHGAGRDADRRQRTGPG
jgi:Ca2+-binding RTX toxin-like protein